MNTLLYSQNSTRSSQCLFSWV